MKADEAEVAYSHEHPVRRQLRERSADGRSSSARHFEQVVQGPVRLELSPTIHGLNRDFHVEPLQGRRMNEALVGYDQWHPEMLISATRRGRLLIRVDYRRHWTIPQRRFAMPPSLVPSQEDENPYAPPGAEIGQSGRENGHRDRPYRAALTRSLIAQAVALVLPALTLDSGRSLRVCGLTTLVYWAGVLAMMWRRPRSPTRSDLVFVRHGCWLLIILMWVATSFL